MAIKRLDIKAILADSELRRRLMVSTIQATQAREGVETTEEQAERAYYVVSEGERAAFFDLERYRGGKNGDADRREQMFVEALRADGSEARTDVALRDFAFVTGSILAYRSLSWVGPLFRELPPLMPTLGRTRSGLNTTEIERFVRLRWEIVKGADRKWVLFAKGGDFSRFYTDWDLVFDWANQGEVFKGIVASKYGSATRFVKSEDDYFKAGITWVQTTNLGINARELPPDGIFGVASPTLFLNRKEDYEAVLALMNSSVFDAIAHCVATRNWGATAIGSIPVPHLDDVSRDALARLARSIINTKRSWDTGNETSLVFLRPWVIQDRCVDSSLALAPRLDQLLAFEASEQVRVEADFRLVEQEVFRLYGLHGDARSQMQEMLIERPPEVLWSQMAGKSPEQKRMEHIWRLLSFAVKRVIEADGEGIVPFSQATGEIRLADRLRQELAVLFPNRDETQLEVELVNELRRPVKGYRRCTSLDDWLANAFFEYHASLYKNRPIFWHLASSQGVTPHAFGAVVHYLRFDKNRMAKLRSHYVRDTIEELRRETALADKAGRSDDRVELQARVEEVQAFDKMLQQIQEGHHEGAEGGEGDFRILTPWKEPSARPRGWNPDLDDGVQVNIAPLDRAGVLRVTGAAG
ncbi:hypothetical protein [Variovorax sp. LjRoot178]|uniref:hypothetical protein n=1 Tax=Variovorax sp. LjRoot178 TaxID=3342277 RepID=UPI003ECC5BB2